MPRPAWCSQPGRLAFAIGLPQDGEMCYNPRIAGVIFPLAKLSPGFSYGSDTRCWR